MFIYSVKSEGSLISPIMLLADWPEISASNTADIEQTLSSDLKLAIRKKMENGELVPVPRNKPNTSINVRLTAGESLKVLVHNEILKSQYTYETVARAMCIPVTTLKRALDLEHPADLDLLSSAINAIGKRLVAYIP